LEALSSLESLTQAGLVAAACTLAVWSLWQARRTPSSAPKTGESAWTIVAIVTLAGVSAAVLLGNGRV
jgi:hypothetical protein